MVFLAIPIWSSGGVGFVLAPSWGSPEPEHRARLAAGAPLGMAAGCGATGAERGDSAAGPVNDIDRASIASCVVPFPSLEAGGRTGAAVP